LLLGPTLRRPESDWHEFRDESLQNARRNPATACNRRRLVGRVPNEPCILLKGAGSGGRGEGISPVNAVLRLLVRPVSHSEQSAHHPYRKGGLVRLHESEERFGVAVRLLRLG
jgi:hypothetical protein